MGQSMDTISIYQFAINNTKTFIRSSENNRQQVPLSVFEASSVLAIAFMKDKEEVAKDLLS